ncbi:MAG: SulP family inorganic anion transporter, partial [Paeniglutamicibacter terrestris]
MTRLPSALRSAATLLPSWRDYRQFPKTWRQDLLAGVTVGIVALPLALAFGVSSGAGAESGLITAIIAGIVAAVFGGSNIQVSGPTGAMVVVLGPVVATQGLGVLAVVCVMAGLIVVAAGLLRLGRTITYIPWPVIEGFTLGIAMIIFLQQVPSAFGVPAGPSSNAFMAAVEALQTVSGAAVWIPLLVVAVVIAVMVVAPRIHKAIPGSIIAIIVVTVGVNLAQLPVATIGALPDSLPAPRLPSADWETLTALLGPALTIAALAAIESLLSARVAASISDTGPYDADRELVGQGLASVASGFFGGMPATGAIARTAVNIRAGGRTRMSAIIHSFVLIIVIYAASGVVGSIPLAALSGVLMVTAARMISMATVKTIVGSTKSDAVVFIVTALITV